jgi:hypothetical protein
VLNIFKIGYEYSYLDSCGGGLIFVRLTVHRTSCIALVIRIFPVCRFPRGLYDHFAEPIECLRSFLDFIHDEMPLASVERVPGVLPHIIIWVSKLLPHTFICPIYLPPFLDSPNPIAREKLESQIYTIYLPLKTKRLVVRFGSGWELALPEVVTNLGRSPSGCKTVTTFLIDR